MDAPSSEAGEVAAPAKGDSRLARLLLIVLTFYGLGLIVPEIYRLVRPLGSFGLTADNNGRIFDVRGPFPNLSDSPAWRAGLRVGDRLDLSRMRCIPVDTNICATILAVRGGQQLVLPGAVAELILKQGADHLAKEVDLVAQPRPSNWLLDFVLFLDLIAGVLVVLGAAWLVLIRPGPMTWGFFVYAIQFNPGQEFEFYARLQHWPAAFLAQQIADCLFQAAGYTGLILFALRVPNDRTEAPWRPLERALPMIAAALAGLTLLSLGSAFGYPTEALTRAGLAAGFFITGFTVYTLAARRKYLSPQDHQRMRWVIWGCLIGLPAFVIASLAQGTSLAHSLPGNWVLPEDVIGLLYLINGVLCLFVVEAIRRPRVINVEIPLRRATMLAMLLSAPVLFLHEQASGIYESIHMPTWGWFLVAWLVVFLISRLHEHGVRLLERLFDIGLLRAEKQFVEVAKAMLRATSAAEIDKLLADAPLRALSLSSSAVFRQAGGEFRREGDSAGWTSAMASSITPKSLILAPVLANLSKAAPFEIDPDLLNEAAFPSGLRQPVIAAPAANERRCFAVAFYGSHVSGADFDPGERGLIGKLATTAAVAYAEVELESLQARVAALEGELRLETEAARPR